MRWQRAPAAPNSSASPEAAHALMLKHAADERAIHHTETLTRIQ